MPAELRHIIFRPAEVVEAVKDYHQRLGKSLPSGAAAQCSPEVDGAGFVICVRIAFAPHSDSVAAPGTGAETRQEVVIEGSTLAAALILYCRERRIPLPTRAEKSLQCFGKQVCLVATINPKRDHLPQLGRLHP